MGGSFLRCGRSGILCDLDSSERKKKSSQENEGPKIKEAIKLKKLYCLREETLSGFSWCAVLRWGSYRLLEVCTARCAFKFYCFLDFEFWILEWGSGVAYCRCCCCCCCRSDMNNETRYGK